MLAVHGQQLVQQGLQLGGRAFGADDTPREEAGSPQEPPRGAPAEAGIPLVCTRAHCNGARYPRDFGPRYLRDFA